MADKITLKSGNQSASVYSSSKVDSLKADSDSKISSINSKLSTMGTADNISALDKRLKSVEGDYLSKKGGNISGNLVLKNGAYANGSRQANSNTIPELIDELRKGTGVNGSVSITTAYSLGGKTLPTGWYNFQWIPHRFGEGENDNSSYGQLIMFPMNFGGEYFYILRYSDGKIAALYKLNIDVNLSDYYKKAEVNSAFAKKSDIPTSLPASDVSAWAKASSKPSYSWSEISGKPTNFITSGNIGSQTVSKAGALIDNSNAGWNVAASWMHSSKSSVGLNDYISVMEATGSNTALIYTAQAKNVKVGSAASADSVAWSNVTGKPSSFPPSSHNHDDRYSITYRGQFYSNGKYVNLGTFSFDGGQAGQYCFIQIFTGSGYNGQVEQDEAIDVHFRIGNGTSEAGYAESHVNGHNECTVYYVKNSNSSYTFYLGKTNWTGWSFYEAKCYGTFKISGAEADSLPSGAVELEKKVIAWKSDIPAALPDVHGLHIGSKYFNGSASVTVNASDLGTQVVDTQNASPQADAMSGAALNIYDYDGSIKNLRTFQFAAGIVDFPAGGNYRSKSVSFSGSGGNPFYRTSGTVKVVVSEVAKDGYNGPGSGEWYNAVKAYGVSNSGFTIYCAPGDAVSVNWIAFKLS